MAARCKRCDLLRKTRGAEYHAGIRHTDCRRTVLANGKLEADGLEVVRDRIVEAPGVQPAKPAHPPHLEVSVLGDWRARVYPNPNGQTLVVLQPRSAHNYLTGSCLALRHVVRHRNADPQRHGGARVDGQRDLSVFGVGGDTLRVEARRSPEIAA